MCTKMQAESVIRLLTRGSSPADAEGGGGTQEYTHRGSEGGGGLLSYSN